MILILLGAPGAGKGTQAEALATATGAAHVATGDLFRAEIAAGSELGRSAASYIDAGKLVPDEITVGMMELSTTRKPLMPLNRNFGSTPPAPATGGFQVGCPATWALH